MVLVVGDAGVGKTRFVAEGMARAAAEGMSSVSGACLPLAEKLPLLPVAEALGELARLEGAPRPPQGHGGLAPPPAALPLTRLATPAPHRKPGSGARAP